MPPDNSDQATSTIEQPRREISLALACCVTATFILLTNPPPNQSSYLFVFYQAFLFLTFFMGIVVALLIKLGVERFLGYSTTWYEVVCVLSLIPLFALRYGLQHPTWDTSIELSGSIFLGLLAIIVAPKHLFNFGIWCFRFLRGQDCKDNITKIRKALPA